MAHAIDEKWEALRITKPEPRIFWEFINAERNNILKEYRFGPQNTLLGRPGRALVSNSMSGGHFLGKDARALADQAIAWWNEYLDEIDAAAGDQR